MANLINSLETCWYISPPWGNEIPALCISLLERGYVTSIKSFGYCCGVEWLQGEWNYAIAVDQDHNVIYTSASQLVGTGTLQLQVSDKPVFALGEKVVFRRKDTTQFRIVQGIHRVEDFWTYTIEWASPELAQCDGKLMGATRKSYIK